MAKIKSAIKSRTNEKQQSRVRAAMTTELESHLADWGDLTPDGVTCKFGEAQVTQLDDKRLPIIQRRALVAQIGEEQGNQYLQKAMGSLKNSYKRADQVSNAIMRQTRPANSNRGDVNAFQRDPRAIQVRDAPPGIARTVGPGGYFLIDPERETFNLLPSSEGSREFIFEQARQKAFPVFQYTPSSGQSFAEAVAENQPQFIDELTRWIGYANLELPEAGGSRGGLPSGRSLGNEGSRLGQSVYLIMSILDMGAAVALKGALRRFARRTIPALRRAARRTGLRGLDEAADNLERLLGRTQSAIHGGERILWGRWEDYPHVTIEGRQYAQIRGRLYTQHAVDRMQPSGNSWARSRVAQGVPGSGGKRGQPEIRIGGRDYGRGVSPENVERVISAGTRTRQANGNISIRSGSVEVITDAFGNNPDGIVVTIILH